MFRRKMAVEEAWMEERMEQGQRQQAQAQAQAQAMEGVDSAPVGDVARNGNEDGNGDGTGGAAGEADLDVIL